MNLAGSNFVLDGVSLDGSLTVDVPFVVNDRDVILTGVYTDGTAFSFTLNSEFVVNPSDLVPPADVFSPDATLTVTLVSSSVLLGDFNSDGVTNFLDIQPFIALLASGEFHPEGDLNFDGSFNFLDIVPFILILAN